MVALLCVLLAAGCKQSLFDARGNDDSMPDADPGGGGDGSIPSSCPAMCLADAAADFGTPKWRFLDDHRNRTWTEMTVQESDYVGADQNRFSTCNTSSAAPACAALSGALLVTTSGANASADPAVSWTSTENQVVQLTIRAHVPASGTDHVVRVYRNTREDVLFTARARPDTTFERAITLDAVSGDRFYVALAPEAGGAEQIGLHVYVNATGDSFPKTCQLALSFSSAAATSVGNACGSSFTYYDYNLTPPQAPMLGAGPIADHGMAADIPMDRYYEGTDVLSRSDNTTTQLWIRHDAFVSSYNAVVFSDEDLDTGGGVAIYLLNQDPPRIGAETCTNGDPLEFKFADAPFPNDHAWHFVRVVHVDDTVQICLDGARVATYPLAEGKMQSGYRPFVGRNVVWLPSGAFFDGAVDDVRVISGALPCDPP